MTICSGCVQFLSVNCLECTTDIQLMSVCRFLLQTVRGFINNLSGLIWADRFNF
jgi:hypothetical protein